MADTNMQEPTAPQNEPVAEPTAKEPEKKSFTQDELDKLFADRQKRGEEAAAKRLEKQYKARMDELTTKLKSFEEKDLTDVEKLRKDYEKSTGKVSELERSLTDAQLENAKLKALIKAGVQPDQLDGLLKRVSGSTEEEIFADVDELKGFGWIGAKPAQETADEKPRGLGTSTKSGEPAQKKSLTDELREITAKLADPKTPRNDRDALIDRSNQIQRRISKGET